MQSPTCPPRRLRAAGFTLMELLIAAAVVSVLALIIVPTYTQQIQKSRRADAKNALIDLAAREEKYYATNNTYTNTAGSLGYTGAFPVAVTNSGVTGYTLNVTAASTSSFSATATRSGPQATDACGDYTINDQGTQANANNSQATSTCW